MKNKVSVLLLVAGFANLFTTSSFAQGAWSAFPHMPYNTGFAAASAFNNKIYVAGGVNDVFTPLADFRVFDPADSSWTTLAPVPQPRYGASLVELDGNLYLIGGSEVYFGPVLQTTLVYNPANNSWSEKAPMATNRIFFGACALGGKIYAVGGSPDNNSGTALKSTEVYDPVSNAWSPGADLPAARGGVSCAALNGRVYVSGGTPGSDSATANTLFVLDTTTRTWSSGVNMPTARLLASSVVLNDKVYVLGGSSALGDNQKLATVESYDPVETKWEPGVSMPTARHGLAAAAVGGKIYAFGGITDFAGIYFVLNRAEVFDPLLVGTNDLSGNTVEGLVSVRPNPSRSEATLTVRLGEAGTIDVRIVDAGGRLARTMTFGRQPAGEQSLPVQLGELQPGTYFIQAIRDGKPFGVLTLMVK